MRRPILFAMLLVLAACAASLWAICVPPSQGATWVHLSFTAPADSGLGIARYRCEIAPLWDSVRIYSAPGVEGVTPGPQGSTCDLYVSQTIQPLTSRTYRIVSIDHAGNRSGASNLCVVATGFPDTIACLSRPFFGDYNAVRTYGATYWGWSIPYGDSAEVHAIHFEELQRQYSRRECELFGSWALRGKQAVCP